MASAVFASRNDNHWGERKVYMRKNPKTTGSSAAVAATTTTTSSSSNPNPRPYSNNAAIAAPIINHHQIGTTQTLELSPRSEDCSSFSHQPSHNSKPHLPGFNHQKESGAYLVFNVSGYSRKEVRELKKRLVGELERVRSFTSWIESRDSGLGTRSAGLQGGEVASSYLRQQIPPLDPARSDGTKQKVPHENNKTVVASGSKRPPPPVVSPREPKRLGVTVAAPAVEKIFSSMIKKCEQILTKLMKHKHGWVFNIPVNAVELGLHDYHQIVKHPMDLGTVKSRLKSNTYQSPVEFAADVRLTFNNALLYNPKGHEVYVMAEQLLRLFEELFGPAQENFEQQQRAIVREHQQRSHVPVPASLPASPVPVPAPAKASTPRSLPPPPLPVLPPQVMTMVRPAVGKQPKPKAKDPNKREMSFEEKQKLSVGLENLPAEKMAQVLQIVRRTNPDPVTVHGDDEEIELDFEALNTETLWELDRFVYNCKKNMSKMRRQEAISAAAAPPAAVSSPATKIQDKVPASIGETPESLKKNRKVGGGEPGEEDVDIGDEEMPSAHFPPVEIEKDAGNESSSSGSSSDSSSSSSSTDSDSRSSTDSDSDADEAQSPAVGLRPPPQPPRS